jgi:hypothetical protein
MKSIQNPLRIDAGDDMPTPIGWMITYFSTENSPVLFPVPILPEGFIALKASIEWDLLLKLKCGCTIPGNLVPANVRLVGASRDPYFVCWSGCL